MNIIDGLKLLKALGAGGLVGALGRVATAAQAAEEGLKRPEFAELKAALDELRGALRSR